MRGIALLAAPAEAASPEDARDWRAFGDIANIVAVERFLVIDDCKIARMSSQSAARLCAGRLQAMHRAAPGERERLVAELLDTLCDEQQVAAKVAEYRRATRGLRFAAEGLWLTTFLAAPIMYWQTRSLFVGDGVIVSGLFLALWSVIVARCFFVRRRLVAESRWASLGNMLLVAVSPGSAMRVAETIGRDRLAGHDPVVVAAVVCPPDDAAAFGAQRMRELFFPRPEDSLSLDSAAGQARAWFRGQLLARRVSALERLGIETGGFFSPPPPVDDARAYCPRCLGQFVFPAGACPECGVVVRAFESTRQRS